MSGDTSPVAAEHARLVAEAAQAGARLKDLQAHRPDRSDEQACTAHKALEDAAGGAAFDAGEAADCYLRQHPDLVPVYGAARRWQALGVSTIAIKSGGSKAPVGKWKQYQGVLPAEDELWRLHHSGHYGLAVLTGLRDSDDGLFAEMLEHEGRSIDEGIFGQFLGELAKEGLSECWQRITDGYWEMSPSGGLHFFWLTEDVCGNTKLAQRPATAEELAAKPEEKVKVLIETRGRGGYVVAAPTPGGFHKSGRPWRAMGGPPESIATITAEEREKIFACARKFHTAGPIHSRRERAKHETLAKPAKGKTGEKAEGKAEDKPATRPGDIFNQRGPDWAELLEPHGWRLHKTDADGTINWTRPGKAGGPSATTGNPRHEDNKLHVFTSSTEFEPDESYSKFAAYVILNHGGDWSAAAAQLARDGYVPGKAAAEKTAAGSDADGEITEITDAHFAERFAAEVLRDGYCWVTGFGGWMAYREARRKERRGARWFRTTDKSMTNLARTWLIREYEAFKDGDPEAGAAVKKKWEKQLSGYHLREVVSLAAGIMERDIAEFDTHPGLLNCANAVADLRTGEKMAHDPAYVFTKTTGVDYVPGARHADWDQALTALPEEVLPWYQVRIGQGATGYMPSDDLVLINIGPGENGKTTVLQGIRHALGDYYVQVPVKALLGDHQEHDTVKMPFRAARIAAVEETPVEGRLNMQQLKQVTTPQIQARLMRQDYVEFDTTHMTIVSTNHEPGIENADHGSVRRVAAVVWPYRYLKPGLPLVLPTDRTGDPGLRERIIAGGQGQHEAALAWMTRGTRQWYQAGQVMPPLPARVRADTDAWIDRVNLMHAFGTAQLAGDTCRWVMSAELYQFFRQVTKDSGNVAWSERTFNARLVEFAASRGWVIEKRKTRHNREALSQPPVDFPAKPPGSYQAWHGLRFRVEADDQAGLDDPDGGHSRDYQ